LTRGSGSVRCWPSREMRSTMAAPRSSRRSLPSRCARKTSATDLSTAPGPGSSVSNGRNPNRDVYAGPPGAGGLLCRHVATDVPLGAAAQDRQHQLRLLLPILCIASLTRDIGYSEREQEATRGKAFLGDAYMGMPAWSRLCART